MRDEGANVGADSQGLDAREEGGDEGCVEGRGDEEEFDTDAVLTSLGGSAWYLGSERQSSTTGQRALPCKGLEVKLKNALTDWLLSQLIRICV